MKEITGRHVALMFGLGFGTIIAVNIALAVAAVRTFPGVETRNSYVASQTFDDNRAAQEALGWDVDLSYTPGHLRLEIMEDFRAADAVIETATLGRATHTRDDLTPEFAFDGTAFTAPAELEPGNWNLRLTARAPDGTLFRQRIVLWVRRDAT